MVTAVWPVTRNSVMSYFFSSVGPSLRIFSTSAAVPGSVCELSGITCTMPRSALRFGVASATALTPSSSPMSLARSSITPTGSVVRMMSTVTSRGVLNPGPKSAADQVVRRPRGSTALGGAGVGQPEGEVLGGQRHHEQYADGDHHCQDRDLRDQGDPLGAERVRLVGLHRRVARGTGPGLRTQPLTGECEHRRHDGQGDSYGDGDRGGRGEAHDGQERDPGDHQAAQRDDHRRPGEDHCAAGRAECAGDRLGAPGRPRPAARGGARR